MRVTPLICIQCGSWFQPKTKRLNKVCSNACRTASHRGIKKRGVIFNPKGEEDKLFFILACANDNIDASPEQCLESLMNNDYDKYCEVIYKWGQDKFGKSAEEWVSKTIQN